MVRKKNTPKLVEDHSKLNGIFIKYDGTFIRHVEYFLDSSYDTMVLEYGGNRLNAYTGFVEDAFKEKIKISTGLRFLKRYLFLKPMFHLARRFAGGEFKNRIYRIFGAKIGKEVFIAEDVYIDEIFPELITIEDGCIIGNGTKILGHAITIKHLKYGRVKIKRQAVIGAACVVQCGVTIGEGSIVAMNSVVNANIPDHDEVGGVPEHEIKRLERLV